MSYIDLISLGSLSASNKITYNYSAIDVQYSNCQYITSNGLSYDARPPSGNSSVVPENTYGIHISNYTPNSSSNISFPESKYTYKSSDIYITPLIHKILTINCDTTGTPTNGIVGEFIIKHTPVGSSNPGNIYLCFLISNNLSALNLVSTNDVDNIINFVMTNGTDSGSIETLLQSTIPIQNNAVQYTNNDKDKIFVFTNPININSKSNNFLKQLPSIGVDSYIPPFLLPFPPKNAQMLTTDNIQTAESDNIYMDCQPTGASADEIKTYNVPINSEYTQNAAKMDLMTFVVQISIIFAILVTTYFMIPRMYKWFIIDNVNKFVLNYKDTELEDIKNRKDTEENNRGLYNNETSNSRDWINVAFELAKNDDNTGENEKTALPKNGIDTHIRIATIDVLLSIFFWSLYFAIGFNGLSFNSVIMGIYFIIFYALSVSTIQFNKMSSNYLKTKIEGKDDKVVMEGFAYPTTQGTKEVTSFFMYSDIILFFTDTINFLVKDKKWFLTFLFVLCVFIFGAAVPIYLASTNNWKLDNIDLTETQKGTLAIIIVYSLLGSSIFYGISRMVRLSRKEWNQDQGIGSTTYGDFAKGIANSINPFAK
jgi:uncharacterized protein YheU (UPF0270 family)